MAIDSLGKNIGFISTRSAGLDGVSFETTKLGEEFEQNGHRCFYLAGELDKPPEISYLVEEAHFNHSKNLWINNRVYGRRKRDENVTGAIENSKNFLKKYIKNFIKKFKIDLLIAENALSYPNHIPLGLAITETIEETGIESIGHHHDFSWERMELFGVNAVENYIREAFPPKCHTLEHVVINSSAQEQLASLRGISSTIIPNVLDFENPPTEIKGERYKKFLIDNELSEEDIIILQPTRVVQRKGIEHAIELVKELKDPCYKLLVSHEAGDEGFGYLDWLKLYAQEHGVDFRLLKTKISNPLNKNNKTENGYSLWDVYPHADLVTYPSSKEGFGNAFLEAIYFRKPLLVNRYATFIRDIEQNDFDLIVMDGHITKEVVKKVKNVLRSPKRRERMVNRNYDIAKRNYSYSILRNRLNSILIRFYGEKVQLLKKQPTV